jgi:hypothetical protein
MSGELGIPVQEPDGAVMQGHPDRNDDPPPGRGRRGVLVAVVVAIVIVIIVLLHLLGVIKG